MLEQVDMIKHKEKYIINSGGGGGGDGEGSLVLKLQNKFKESN